MSKHRRFKRNPDSTRAMRWLLGSFADPDLLGNLISEHAGESGLFTGLKGSSGADARAREFASNARAIGRQSLAQMNDRLEALEAQAGGLMLKNRALLRILKARPNWSEDQFRQKLMEIDQEDGRLDDRAPASKESL